MKRAAVALALLITITLTGCGEPSIAEAAKFKQECESAGGRVWADDTLALHCDMTTREK